MDETWTRTALLVLVGVCGSSCAALFGYEVPGDTHQFDPVQAVPELRAVLDAGYQLERVSATGVRPDGTINLDDERVEGRVLYGFVRSVAPPLDPPPIGAGGSLDGRWSQSTLVVVERRGLHLVSTSPETVYRSSRGMQINEREPEPGGTPLVDRGGSLCSFAELFRAASGEGAPMSDIVASIHYFAGNADAGASYHFTIEDTPFSYVFDQDCLLVE